MQEVNILDRFGVQDFFTPEQINEWCKFDRKDIDRENPTGIFDDILAENIKRNIHIVIVGSVPHLYLDGYYRADISGTILKTIIKCAIPQKLRTDTIIRRVFNLIISDYELQKSDADLNRQPGHWTCFRNGWFDASNGRMYKHTPDFYNTYQIPYSFDPTKAPPPEDGKIFENFIAEAMSKEDRETLLQYMGYCTTRSTKFQVFVILYGSGGTGKSVVISLTESMIGAENVSSIAMQDLEKPFHAIQLHGKLLNTCADLQNLRMDTASKSKAAISGDLISDSWKGKDLISFRPFAKMIFSCNELPSIGDKSDGFFRRMIIIRMDHKPEIQDTGLLDKLKEEKSMHYILYQAMQAYHRALKAGKIFQSKQSAEEVQEYRIVNDSLASFLDEHVINVEPIGNEPFKISRTYLFEKFNDYCEALRCRDMSANGFYKAMESKGYPTHRDSKGRYFYGIDYVQEKTGEKLNQGYIDNPFIKK